MDTPITISGMMSTDSDPSYFTPDSTFPADTQQEDLFILNFGTRLILAASSRKALMSTALETLADFSASNRLALLIYDHDYERFYVRGIWKDNRAHDTDNDLARCSAETFALLRQKKAHIAPLVIQEDIPLPAPKGHPSLEPGFCLSLPLVADQGMLLGVATLAFTPEHRPSFEDMQHLRVLSTIIAVGLTNQRLFDERDLEREREADEERRRIAEKMVDAQKLESLGVMAGGIAHDFNNLLATVLGNTELVMETASLSPDAAACLKEARDATLKAADLSRQMLTYAGHQPVQLRPLNLNATLHQIQHLLEANLSRKTKLTYSETDPLPDISADPAQIHQVLVNLITNADEAIEERDGTIEIRTGVTQLNRRNLHAMVADPALLAGPYVYVAVADNGCGMKSEMVRSIFEPFYTTKFIGRGLGLAALHGIVRAHRGAIHISSKLGSGTTITVYFPVLESSDGPKLVVPPESIVPRPRIEGPTYILVVDDEDSVRNVIQYVLNRSGYEVLSAIDGMDAMEVFQANAERISVILLDLKMPRMSGAEVFEAIHKTHPQIPIIILTGYSEDRVIEDLRNKRPAGFIQKPFEIKQLIEAIQQVT